jgi:Leucine-rich repeat (LRR) protein
MEEEKEIVSDVEMALSMEHTKQGLGVIGKHPVLLNHTFLELKVIDAGVGDISLLEQYPNIMYLDLSKNSIESASVLQKLPTLVQLNLSNNKLKECLDFSLNLCSKENAWSDGDSSIGSMLTNANLSFNSISKLNSLSNHPFLEVLVLNNNCIDSISGISELKFLRVLDLSFNSITSISGLDGAQVIELNLQGNQIADLSGIETCSKLSSLNISKNNVKTLMPLQNCLQLLCLDARDNGIQYIRQCDFISKLEWLSTVLLMGNPCSKKEFYRRRVIYRLPDLRKLDESDVTAEERIECGNLFHSDYNDIEGRKTIFNNHFTKSNMMFIETAPFADDECDVTIEELQTV